jgi:hypothetical protein
MGLTTVVNVTSFLSILNTSKGKTIYGNYILMNIISRIRKEADCIVDSRASSLCRNFGAYLASYKVNSIDKLATELMAWLRSSAGRSSLSCLVTS